MSKVLLDKEASECLKQMIESLKVESKFTGLRPSKLNSWIIKRFSDKYFKSDKRIIVKEYFDPKDHLKFALAKADSEEELMRAMELSLKQMKKKSKGASLNDH